MSTRNPTEWTEIGETVRSAQDVLCRLGKHKCMETFRHSPYYVTEYPNRFFLGGPKDIEQTSYHLNNPETGETYWTPFSRKDMSPPQTLGELCLELVNQRADHYVFWCHEWGLPTPPKRLYYLPEVRKQVQKLRELMYRRNTEPLDYGDGLLTPHNPILCFELDCPVHGKWSFKTHCHEVGAFAQSDGQ